VVLTRRKAARLALLAAAFTATLAACACEAAPAPTATPTVGGGDALRAAAEAYVLARTEARFDDSHAMTSSAFQAVCDSEPWLVGLLGEVSILRALSGLDDDAYLEWGLVLVEVDGDEGSVVLTISHDGRPVGAPVAETWRRIDGAWRYDEPPAEICN
jgi:hypothetical protein